MKRLFCVAFQGSNNPHSLEGAGQSPWFDDKELAKKLRDELGEKYHISIGPDHWRYGIKGNPRTHSHNCRSGGPGNGFPKRVKK